MADFLIKEAFSNRTEDLTVVKPQTFPCQMQIENTSRLFQELISLQNGISILKLNGFEAPVTWELFFWPIEEVFMKEERAKTFSTILDLLAVGDR